MILIYDSNGRILRNVLAPDNEVGLYTDPDNNVMLYAGPLTGDSFVANGVVMERTPQPSPFHLWDWTQKVWEENVQAAKQAKYDAINSTVLGRRVSPIAYDGTVFDADAIAKERIISVILRGLRGGLLPAGWLGWKDRNNALQWGALPWVQVQTKLSGLAQAIEDREQALLAKAWALKQVVSGAQTLAEVGAVDVETGWPT